MLRATLLISGAFREAVASTWRTTGSALASIHTSASTFSTGPEMALGMSLPLRIARGFGIGLAFTAIALPAGTMAALLVTGRDEADALELLRAVPRTLRVLWWSLWAAYNYKTLAASFAASSITEETYREALATLHVTAARRLLHVCQSNGGVYVKAGQHAVSMQAVPPAYRVELEALEDSVPPHAFDEIDRVLVAELGGGAATIFAEFEQSATAAASLAQVHKATTKEGVRVAVKVQYPGLESAVAADLTTMVAIASVAAYLFPQSDWRWLFTELRTKLVQELDFGHEAGNAMRLAACFAGRKEVAVPRLFPELSTRRVLCMEWIDGAKISDVQALRRMGLAPRQVGLTLLDTAAEMMCVHGFVHGDMHPGNVFVRALPGSRHSLLARLLPWCRARPQIVFLDHGLYFELQPELRQLYCMMWCAIVLNDSATVADTAVQLAGPRAGRALPAAIRPRDWSRVPPEERRQLQREAGYGGVRDLTRMLSEAPRALIDCLRAMAMARHAASRLGASVADRLRVNAVQALNGLQVEVEDAAGRRRRVRYIGVMRSRWKRLRLRVTIFAMRVTVWMALLLHIGGGGEEEMAMDR